MNQDRGVPLARMLILAIVFFVAVLFTCPVFAATIILKSGEKIEDVVIRDATENSIETVSAGKTVRYKLDDINILYGGNYLPAAFLSSGRKLPLIWKEDYLSRLSDAELSYTPRQGIKGEALSNFNAGAEAYLFALPCANIDNFREGLGEALFHFEEAIKIQPDFDDAQYNIGKVYEVLGESQQAILYYQKAIKINPKNAKALNNLGCFYYNKGLYKKIKNRTVS